MVRNVHLIVLLMIWGGYMNKNLYAGILIVGDAILTNILLWSLYFIILWI